jgi:hypothetical protein
MCYEVELYLLRSKFHKTGLDFFRCIACECLPYQVDMIAHYNKCMQGNFFIARKVLQTTNNYLFVFIGL